VESDYVLLHTSRGVVQPDVVSPWSFNHAILAIRMAEADAAGLPAAIRQAGGATLFFDPTDDLTPVGMIRGELQGTYGLRVAGGTGELNQLPLLDPKLNRLDRKAHFTIQPTGAIAGEVREVRLGGHAASRRSELMEMTDADRPKVLERFLGSFVDRFALQKYSFENLNQFDLELRTTYAFAAENYARRVGNLLLVRPRVLGAKADYVFTEKERKYGVEFGDGPNVQTDTYEFTLPDGYEVDELPAPIESDYGFASYRSKVEVQGKLLRYQREYTIRDVRVPKEKLAELRRLYGQIGLDERNAVLLRQVR
jgi:hypothetical protein